jgi:hypothetical protein
MTLILPTFFFIEKLISIGSWPDWASTRRLIEWFERKGDRYMVLLLSKFVTLHAYAKTLGISLNS